MTTEVFCLIMLGKLNYLRHCNLSATYQGIENKFKPNKAHGYNSISVTMLQLCGSEFALKLPKVNYFWHVS